MVLLLQGIISSLSIGAIYALLALSYTMIFGTLRVAHFAQGDIFMVGMLIAYEMFVVVKLPFIVTLLLTIIVTIGIMLFIERSIYRPMFDGAPIYLFMCTIGMSTFLKNFAQLIFGNETFAFPSVFGDTAVQLSEGLTVVPQNIAVIVVSLILMVALALFVKKTKTGMAMSAVSMNRSAAALMGVKFVKTVVITYAIAAGLAAVSGVFTAPIFKVNTSVSTIGLKALIAAIMGGFGNMYGAILGGVLLGFVETLGSIYISSAFKEAISFIVFIIILIFRPQGLLGQNKITKV
jgi:branched-chain amino acid transport system permease protein